jgi:hypothetical protein
MKNENDSKILERKRKPRFFSNLTQTFFQLLDKMQTPYPIIRSLRFTLMSL